MALPAGKRDTRIEVLRSVTFKDALNADIASWSTVGTIWAAKADVSDGERVRAAEVGAILTSRFRVLRNAFTRTITPRDRIVIGAQTFDITGIKELDRVGFEITAAARQDLE